MKKILSFNWVLIIARPVLVLLSTLLFTFAGEPWYTNHRLEWKPFTALPEIENPNNYAWHWDIQERSTNGNSKFFAQSMLWNSRGKFLVADADKKPKFVQYEVDQTPGIPQSTTMSRWNKDYDEYFVATSLGLFRFDEDSKQFAAIWSFPYDYKLIASVGSYIFGTVNNAGSQSGQHIWKPNGEHIYDKYGGVGYSVWGDPVSGKYGIGNSVWVRVVSPTKSIYLDENRVNDDLVTRYSVDGETTFKSPVGIRNDGKQIYLNNFYWYSDDTVIISLRYSGYYGLWIGSLGGTFYPLSFPTSIGSTFFYSPTTRLMIVNQNVPNNLYYTILPAPDEEVLPKMRVKPLTSTVVVSWDTQHVPVRVQSSTDLAVWQDVTEPQVVVEDEIQVTVPRTPTKMFYRFAYPQ